MKKTVLSKATTPPPLDNNTTGPLWKNTTAINIDEFRPESSGHHPATEVRITYDDNGLYITFLVNDRFVRSIQTKFNAPVCTDSCVEFFVRPKNDKGYLNFETNCGGTMLAYYIEDWRRTPDGFAEFTPLTTGDAAQVKIYHSMPEIVDPEITEPAIWQNSLFIPFSLMEKYVGKLGSLTGQTWHANFYKCADETSHPHWAAWNPVKELNFHDPESFGIMTFN